MAISTLLPIEAWGPDLPLTLEKEPYSDTDFHGVISTGRV